MQKLFSRGLFQILMICFLKAKASIDLLQGDLFWRVERVFFGREAADRERRSPAPYEIPTRDFFESLRFRLSYKGTVFISELAIFKVVRWLTCNESGWRQGRKHSGSSSQSSIGHRRLLINCWFATPGHQTSSSISRWSRDNQTIQFAAEYRVGQSKLFLIFDCFNKLETLRKAFFVLKFNMFVTKLKPKLLQLHFYFRMNFTEN